MDKTDYIISAIIAGFIGVVLLASLIPEMMTFIKNLVGDSEKYKAIICTIPVFLAIGIIKGILSGGNR